ncbi:MAG TPA: GYF domain-containing protein [Rhizomicrobium sp.]|nr:GYF domain-containing protein [Rhizomicrobium sp.]
MSDTWTISVAGRAYGPYTAPQMQGFVAEGRLAPGSLVARDGENQYRAASEDPVLAALFRPVAAPQPAPKPQFFTAEGNEELQPFGRNDDEAQPGQRAHFLIVADMKSRSISGLEEEIFNLGPAVPILPQAWLLASDMAINAIRQALVQKLGKLDTLFIADATHDKAAWFNFGPEADSRIRRIWQKIPDAAALKRAG